MRSLLARSQSGQSLVETAIVFPTMIFMLLGIIQLTLAYHARMVSEYAAFKAARAASVYRLDCRRIRGAALAALIPSMPAGRANGDVAARYAAIARRVLPTNRSRVGTPLVVIDYRLDNRRPQGQFDTQLEAGANPMKVHVRLAYLFEYRIPFVNAIMTRYWLATQIAYRWAQKNPLMAMRDANRPPVTGGGDPELVLMARNAIQRGYFTAPIVTSWSMRMMTDPLPDARDRERCQ
ncbi:MAG: TadE family protein [Myxococcales bacterium]